MPAEHPAVIIPMDHGLSLGAIPGLEHPARLLEELSAARVDGTLMSTEIAKTLGDRTKALGMSPSITADNQYWGLKPGSPEKIRSVMLASSVRRAEAADADTYKLIMGWAFSMK